MGFGGFEFSMGLGGFVAELGVPLFHGGDGLVEQIEIVVVLGARGGTLFFFYGGGDATLGERGFSGDTVCAGEAVDGSPKSIWFVVQTAATIVTGGAT